MKGCLKQLRDLRRQGKLNDKIQAEIKEEYEKQKKVTRKRESDPLLIDLLMKRKHQNTKFRVAYANHSPNPRELNPILIKYSITFSSEQYELCCEMKQQLQESWDGVGSWVFMP